MTDIDSEEVIEGPRVSSALEFGATPDRPNTRHNWWFRSFVSDSARGEGLLFKVARRPRTRRDDDPHPTVRLVQENPNGILYAKVKSGEIRVENYHDYINRKILEARDELAKQKKK